MIVASFFAPRQVMWGLDAAGYHRCLKVLDASCKRLGLRHVVLSDSERPGFETAVYPLPENLMQAFLSAQLQLLESAREPILLTGADCILTADPRGVVGEHDMAITVGPFADCRMNTGAIFIKDGPKVAKVWREALASNPVKWGEDQTSLYRAILASDLDVLELPCTEYNWAPESPDDPAGMPMVAHFRGPRKGWMQAWYQRFVIEGGASHRFRRGANVSIDAIMQQFEANCARDLPWFVGARPHKRSLSIVGGAPSLMDSLPDIRRRKGTVWALNNAWRVLADARVKPDAIVIMDARPENVAFVQDGPDCQYLIASMAHPDLFDALCGRNVTVWHADQTGSAERGILSRYQDRPWALVPGGGTVGLRAMVLGYMAGYRNIHLYGMDSSYAGDAHHAYPQALNDHDPTYTIKVPGLGTEYRCAGWMARQADEFQKFRAELGEHGCRIWAHGTGLIPDLSRFLNRSNAHERATAVQGRGRGPHRPALDRLGQSGGERARRASGL
jgi:uncharacterized Rossmann fold enzyme